MIRLAEGVGYQFDVVGLGWHPAGVRGFGGGRSPVVVRWLSGGVRWCPVVSGGVRWCRSAQPPATSWDASGIGSTEVMKSG